MHFKPTLNTLALTVFLFLLTTFLFLLFFHPETAQPAWLLLLLPLYGISCLLFHVLPRSLLRAVRWIVFLPLIFLIMLSIVSQFVPDSPPEDFLITHNFVNLSQIHRITKYRACAGHQTVEQYSDEPISNMQHYIPANPGIDPGQIQIFAPFDGYVLGDAPFTLADGITLIPQSGIAWWPFNQWRINFPHTHVLPEFQNPPLHEVHAGDLIGYVNSMDRYGQRNFGTQVRVGVLALPPQFKNGNGEPFKKLDSVFNYMSAAVFAEYKTALLGLESPTDAIITKEYRRAHPCKFKEGGPTFLDNPPYFESGPIEDLPLEEQDLYIGVRIDDIKSMIKARMCDDPEEFTNNPECLNQ